MSDNIIRVRPYEPADYPTMVKWWEGWKWTGIPDHALPKLGLIVEKNGKDVCAAWIYKTDSSMCLLEWFISDPFNKDRAGCVEALIESAKDVAKALGYSTVFCSVKNKHLMKKLEGAGFVKGDVEMTNFIGSL